MQNKYWKFSIPWIIFGLFLIFQHSAVFMHFDDFGYASLSYGYSENHNGMNWNIEDLFSFLKWHYLCWGGRIFYYIFYILLLRCGENAIQIFQAVLLWGVFFTLYQLLKRRALDYWAVLVTLLLYASIGAAAAIDGIFWYAASAGYVWPFLPFFAALYLMKNGLKTKASQVTAAILMFMAGCSQEQVAAFVIVFLVTVEICDFIQNGRVKRSSIGVLVAGILGALIEILAPGNFVRSGAYPEFNALSFWEKVQKNLPGILQANLGKTEGAFVIVWILAVLCLGYLYKAQNPRYQWITIMNICSAIGVLISWILEPENGFAVCFRLIFVVISVVELLFYYARNVLFFGMTLGAAATQVMMLMSPSMFPRCALPYQFVMLLIFGSVFLNAQCGYKKFSFRICFLAILVIASANLGMLTIGYYGNKHVNEENRKKLKETSALVKAGEEITSLVLYRLPDDRFSSAMPYQEGCERINEWIKKYYEIPQDVTLIWDEYYSIK